MTTAVGRRTAARIAIGVVALLGVVGVIGAVVLQERDHTAAGARPDFSLTITSAGRSAPQGGAATWQLAASGTGGFTGRVAYAVTGVPAGASASLGNTSTSLSAAAPTAQTLLTVGTTAATPTGTSVVTVTGTSGVTERSVTASLTVVRAADGSVVVTPGPAGVADGARTVAVPAAPGSASPGSAAARSFTISTGELPGALAPGAPARPLDLQLSNPHHEQIDVTELRVTISGTSVPACAASNFSVTPYRGPSPLRLGADAQRVPLSDLGVPADQWPQLTMLDLPTNQDACKGVTLTLTYAGSARSL